MDQAERSAVLVVRVWREAAGSAGSVRGRITMTANADEASSTETVVASADEILDLVRNWLDEFESG
ncbi:MAG: hypothetical protein ACXVRK_01550 [Gaiellaceae bacterium]